MTGVRQTERFPSFGRIEWLPPLMKIPAFVCLVAFLCSFAASFGAGDGVKPNVVFILADDLAYGDL